MLRRLVLVAVLASLMAVTAPAAQVFACSCMQMTPELALANADAAWEGVVTSLNDPDADPVRYTFAIEKMVKGESAISVDVRSARSSAGCGMEFALNQRWRIYAFAGDGAQLQTGLCSGNELLAENVPAPAVDPSAPPIQLLVALGGAIVLAAISAWAFLRRPRPAA